MRKIWRILSAGLLMLLLAACNQQGLPVTHPDEPKPEEYIWTMTIDQQNTEVLSEELGASAVFTLKLSMSKEGGDTPFGVYRGEVYYDQNVDFGMLAQFMDGTDAGLWGRSDNFEIDLGPYDKERMDAFRASLAEQGREPGGTDETEAGQEPAEAASSLPPPAPLVQTHAMHFGENIPFTEKDFSTNVSVPGGFLDIYNDGDTAHASVNLYEFGSASASGEMTMPYSVTLDSNTGSDEMYVIFTIYGGGGASFVFRGTIDKVLLSDTIAVGD